MIKSLMARGLGLGLVALSTACGTLAPTSQTVEFETDPHGAVVTVDGVERGTTATGTLSVSLDRGSDHQVIFEKDGYLPITRTLVSKKASVQNLQNSGDVVAAPFMPKRELDPGRVYVQLIAAPEYYDYEPDPVPYTEPTASDPEPAPAPPPAPSMAELMADLVREYKAGRLTSEQFEQRKQELLSGN